MEQFDERLRKIENELARMASLLEFEQVHQRTQLEQHRLVLEEHRVILTGDADREGLLAWRNRMDSRWRTAVKLFAAVGAALMELIRERLSVWLR